MRERHPRNAPGDFYVELDCCMSCGVWEGEAAGLMEWDDSEYPQCFVARQPSTTDDLERMVRALGVQDVGCIRFCGSNPDVARRLIAAGEALSCDRQDIVEQLLEQAPPIWVRRLFRALFGR